MKISVAICDDLKEHCVQNARMLKNYGQRNQISFHIELFENGQALIDALRPGRWDIVLLDIFMPELDGIETARLLRQQDQTCSLIFVTTSEQHGMVSYELRASDYLVKPVAQQAMDEALDWCLREKREYFRSLCVRSDWSEVEIALRDICYIEIQRHNAYIHTKERVVQTSRGMNALEEEIGSPDFLRCHRSFLVNQHHVVRLEKREFIMDNGDRVPIGSSNAAEIEERFRDWAALARHI